MVTIPTMSAPVKIFVAILVAFLPVVLLAIILPVNEYTAQGINAVDCDGPLSVSIFTTPSYLLYGFGFMFFMKRYLKVYLRLDLILSIICCLILIAITPNSISVIDELTNVNDTPHCGAKNND